MWSLPDIKTMNERASAEAGTFSEELLHPENHECDGCGGEATQGFPWYDIFSDDIKGIDWACDECENEIEYSDAEFACAHCERRMVKNYTHELYYTYVDEEQLCLACAANWWFGNPANWFDPHEVKTVGLDKTGLGLPLWDPKTGHVNMSATKHVLAHKQPEPEGVVYFDNMEFDMENGRQISGDDPIEVFKRAAEEGHDQVSVVLDTTWQFAVSIGIYVKSK